MKKSFLLIGFSIAAVCITWPSFSYKNGPDAGLTNAPGESTCVDCHNSSPLDGGPGTATIDVNNLSTTYYPGGGEVVVNIAVQQKYINGFGFEITALDDQGNKAGSFSVPSGVGAKIITKNGKEYVTHSKPGGSNQTASWDIKWTPPATDIGNVTMYASFVSADLDGTNQGDDVYTDSRDLAPDATGITKLDAKKWNLEVSPNPSTEGVWMKFINKNQGRVQVNLTDLQGRDLGVIYQSALPEGMLFQQYVALPNGISKGMYFLNVRVGNDQFAKKILIH